MFEKNHRATGVLRLRRRCCQLHLSLPEINGSKAQLIGLLLLDDKIEKQKEIAEFVGCNPSYISQIKNEHKDLFESDSKPNSKGQDLLKKNREMLQSFYKKEGIGEKVIFKSKG